MEIQSEFSVHNATLHPPALSPDDDGAEIPWVLLDQSAYVAQRDNATTAASETWDGKRIQVTLCLARPPRVSYLCVFCPGLPHTLFPLEPKILVVEEDFVLLRIIVTTRSDILKDADYYIYRAADAATGGGPSLKRLPRPLTHYAFDSHQVGILRCGTSHHHNNGFILRPHRGGNSGDFYLIAALCRARNSYHPGEFVLCLYNSNCPTSWSTHNISLDQQHRRRNFVHINSKVISIGGDAGTMGFVDLWRGILFCDVLRVEQGKPAPPLRYVPLPPPLLPDILDRGEARLGRDIAVLQQGRTIKYVELQVHWKPSPIFRDHYVKDGWMSRTWTRPVASAWSEDCWDPGHKQESSDIPVVGNPHFELLPKLLDHRGMPLKPFKGLDICQPTLSLNDDDATVYFMTKKNRMDDEAWVIAVDMNNNTLQAVAQFSAERNIFINFTYMHSRISAYLTSALGTKGNLKRPGTVLLGSCSKKSRGFWMSLHPWDEQKQHDSEMEVDGDDN